jgi:pyruvate/2-oxoglutarate dehydrogenase complex dihydrolipoamide acyltransferase (E2) component
MELECFHNGRVAQIIRGDGDEVPVGEVIAHIAAPGEGAAAPPAAKFLRDLKALLENPETLLEGPGA